MHFKDVRTLSALRLSKGWVRKYPNLRMRIGCRLSGRHGGHAHIAIFKNNDHINLLINNEHIDRSLTNTTNRLSGRHGGHAQHKLAMLVQHVEASAGQYHINIISNIVFMALH